jgi:hypothetical protein
MNKLAIVAHGRKAHNKAMKSLDEEERRSAESMPYELYPAYWNGIGMSDLSDAGRAAQGKLVYAAALQSPTLSSLAYSRPYDTHPDYWYSRAAASRAVKTGDAALTKGLSRRAWAETALQQMTGKFAQLILETYGTSVPEAVSLSSVETVLRASNTNMYAQNKGNLKEGAAVMSRHMRQLDLTTVLTLKIQANMRQLPAFELDSSTKTMDEFVRRTFLHNTFFSKVDMDKRFGGADHKTGPQTLQDFQEEFLFVSEELRLYQPVYTRVWLYARTRFIYLRWFSPRLYGGEEHIGLTARSLRLHRHDLKPKHQDIVDAARNIQGTGLGTVSPDEDGRGGVGGGKRYRTTGGSMEGAAETLGQLAGSSVMNFLFPTVADTKKTSAVTEKVYESSTAAIAGPGPVQRQTRRRLSTVPDPEPAEDESMEEERSESSSEVGEDDADDDTEWYGSASSKWAYGAIPDGTGPWAYGAIPDGTAESDRSIVFYVLCKRAQRCDPVACGMLYDRAVALDPVDVLFKVKGVWEWCRGRLETNSESLHSDTWKITFLGPSGSLETNYVVRLCWRDVRMVDNETATTDDILDALVLEIVVKYEIHPLPGVAVPTLSRLLESVRRAYLKEKEAFVEELLRIVKQAVFRMIREGNLMVAHEQFHVESYFFQSIDQLDRPGLRVYVPDFVLRHLHGCSVPSTCTRLTTIPQSSLRPMHPRWTSSWRSVIQTLTTRTQR